jgi:hypothetical protein
MEKAENLFSIFIAVARLVQENAVHALDFNDRLIKMRPLAGDGGRRGSVQAMKLLLDGRGRVYRRASL